MSVTAAGSTVDGSAAADHAGAASPRGWDLTWVWQVSALSVLLGIMLALAIRTTYRVRDSSERGQRLGVSAAFLSRYQDQNQRLEMEIKELRRQVDYYVASMDDSSRATEQLKRQFDDLKRQAGLSAVSGPGLKITVRDSAEPPATGAPFAEYMVHDQDLRNLIAELKGAGAQHLAISGRDEDNLQRVVVTTTARCVGPTAIVNNTPLSAPYHIFVLGDPRLLREMLTRPGGYIRQRELDVRKMVEIEEREQVTLPEYGGTLNPRYAKPLPETG